MLSRTQGSPVRMSSAAMGQSQPLKYPTYEGQPLNYPTYESVPSVDSVSAVPYSKTTIATSLRELVAPYSCEAIGTFFFSFIVTTIACNGSQGYAGIAVAFTLMALVYAMGPISGGHFNPAVSFACILTGKIPWYQGVGYICCQYWGGLCGGLLSAGVFFNKTLDYGVYPPYSWYEASICEIAFTGMLCFVVLNCAYSERNNPSTDKNQFYALAIGLVLLAGSYSCTKICVGIFNPCLALGMRVVRTDILSGFDFVLQYTVAEFCGAIIGALLYYLVREETFDRFDDGLMDVRMSHVPGLAARLLAELVGTYMVVLTFCLNVLMDSSMTAWATGAAVISMTYSLCNVSGAHFNPAVTWGVCMAGRKKLPGMYAFLYVVAQGVAAILAGLTSRITNAAPATRMPIADFTWYQIMGAELIFTSLLVYVLLACVTTTDSFSDHGKARQNFYYALAIGSCYIAGGLVTRIITAGSLNPALSFGLATFTSSMPMKEDVVRTPTFAHAVFYTVFELTGASVAAFMYRLSHAKEYWSSRELEI